MSDISVNENYVLLPQELGVPKGNCKYCKSKSLFFKITEQNQPELFLEKVHGSKSYFNCIICIYSSSNPRRIFKGQIWMFNTIKQKYPTPDSPCTSPMHEQKLPPVLGWQTLSIPATHHMRDGPCKQPGWCHFSPAWYFLWLWSYHGARGQQEGTIFHLLHLCMIIMRN